MSDHGPVSGRWFVPDHIPLCPERSVVCCAGKGMRLSSQVSRTRPSRPRLRRVPTDQTWCFAPERHGALSVADS